jgi:muconate cycloisomerase
MTALDPLYAVAVETFLVSLPLRRPHFWAGLSSPSGAGYVVVKVTLNNGVVGWGETQAIASWGGDDAARYGETGKIAALIIRDTLLSALEDVDVRSFHNLHVAMNKAIRGYPYAKAGIEVAILDAVGRSLGVPVYQLLGGCVRDRIPIAHSIGLMDAKAAANEAVQVVAEGIMTLKIKVGVDIDRDVAVVHAVRHAIGDVPTIRIDGNQGYRNWRDALQALERMRDDRVTYAEQLVDGLEGMAEISARSTIPIMADESVWTERDVVKIAAAKAAQYLSVYYTKPGGLWKAKRLLVVAGAHGMSCDVNGSGEMGIGNAANLHLAASAPEICLPGTIPVTSTAEIERTKVAGRKYLDDIIATPFVYDNGSLLVPRGPGLGIEVDEDKIRRYTSP